MSESHMPETPWHGQMITGSGESAPLLRKTFTLDAGHGAIASAHLRASALGIVEAFINGEPASLDVLCPGWSAYEQRLRYAQWEVSALLEASNTLILAIGNGWYRGRLGWMGLERVYGQVRAGFAELAITYADGHEQLIVTDASWTSGPSGILSDDLYDGQTIDASGLMPRHAHSADESSFSPAQLVGFDTSILDEYIGPPVRRHEERTARVVGHTAEGELLLDFEQNMVGWTRIQTTGIAGTEIVVHHAEVLEDGDLALKPLRSAKATDRFILSGGFDTFEPSFTLHGFRYVRIAGWQGTDDEAVTSIRAIVVGSQLERIGTFTCSDAGLDQLHRNIVWGMRGNFVDVPTDCPQRDERLGYVGDLAAFMPTATYLYDIEPFLQDWLVDLNIEQSIGDGQVPLTAPNLLKYERNMAEDLPAELTAGADANAFVPAPMALWQDGAVWIPWNLWEAYGNQNILEQQRSSIDEYLAFLEGALNADGTLTAGYQLGDWLDPAAPPNNPREARADREVVATACMFRSVDLAARIARVLGDPETAEHREQLAARIRSGFTATYVTDDGHIRSNAPTVYALAIAFGLLTEELEQSAGDRLAQLIADGGHVIATGFIGTPFVLHALSATGHTETAYKLATQTECPSWLYQVDMGATTIWERWDSLQPDGSVNPGEMTSFNHYAFGSVGDWMHRVIAGISPLEPGYRRTLFAPQTGGNLSSASAGLQTPYGQVSIHWTQEADTMIIDLEVAPGTEGVLRLPGLPDRVVNSGSHRYEERISS